MGIDTLWFTRCPTPSGVGIAAITGSLQAAFDADGIEVQSLAASADRNVRQSHFGQTQPNSFRHGGPIPPLIAASRGADIAVVGLAWSAGRTSLLGLPGSGINGPADLRGRRLSLPIRVNDPIDFWRAATLRAYRRVLGRAGLTLADVELVEVPIDRAFVDDSRSGTDRVGTLWDGNFMLGHQREEAVALVRGEVDVIYSSGSIATIVQAAFGAVVAVEVAGWGATPDPERGVSTFTISGALVRERPDLARRVVAEARSAAQAAADDEERVKAIIARETGLPVDLVDATFRHDIHRRLDFDLADDKRTALRDEAAFLHEAGFLERAVDVDSLFVAEGALAEAAA